MSTTLHVRLWKLASPGKESALDDVALTARHTAGKCHSILAGKGYLQWVAHIAADSFWQTISIPPLFAS